MSNAALDAPEYTFSYVGAPATDAAKLKSLKLAGPLLLAKQHKVIELLPDAFDDTSYAPNFQATQTDMHEMLFAGSLLDADMVKDGVHFALSKGRMAKFIFDLDHGGMDWTPIKGEDTRNAKLQAVDRRRHRSHPGTTDMARKVCHRRGMLDGAPRVKVELPVVAANDRDARRSKTRRGQQRDRRGTAA